MQDFLLGTSEIFVLPSAHLQTKVWYSCNHTNNSGEIDIAINLYSWKMHCYTTIQKSLISEREKPNSCVSQLSHEKLNRGKRTEPIGPVEFWAQMFFKLTLYESESRNKPSLGI